MNEFQEAMIATDAPYSQPVGMTSAASVGFCTNKLGGYK